MAYISFQPSDHFNTKLYTGTGSSNTVTGVGFQPDFTWIKNRGDAESHCLFDAVRTNGYYLKSDATSAEIDGASAGLWSAFASDGFTVLNGNRTNDNGDTYASWNWKANGAGSSNTDGDITATVSASTTSGFSIIKFTSAGSVSQSYGHGLSGTPKLWIIKDTSTSSNNWQVYYNGTDRLKLDTNEATSTTASQLMSANATTITTPSYADGAWGNGSGLNYITYAFQEIKGFSKIGKYTGNGNADGVYQHLGFSASWLMIKRTDSTASWVIFDNKRLGYNVANYQLYSNSTSAEGNNVLLDITSQGFKCRANHLDVNGSGASYIYLAFAEAPLVSSNGVPAVAR